MTRLVFALAAAALGALSLTTTAAAQEGRGYSAPAAPREAPVRETPEAKASRQMNEKGREKGMKDAPALVSQSGRACTVSDALYKGSAKNKNAEGKTVTTDVYEVACQEGLGLIVLNAGGTVSANDCLQYQTAAASAADPAKALTCALPANANPEKALQPLLARAGSQCQVAKARWIGYSPTALVNQYEVGCADNSAYILTVPTASSQRQLAADSCIKASSAGITCQYLPPEQIKTQIAALAAPANRQCQVSQARYVGSSSSGTSFYEVGCADEKSGYMFETDAQGRFTRAIDCARAGGIGGGCTFTNAVVAESEGTGTYTKLASEIGYKCNVTQYRSLGLDAQGREVVELACSDHPEGAIVMLPVNKGQKGEVYNCIRAEARSLKCGLTKPDTSYSKITQQISGRGKECTVNNARGMGSDDKGNEYVEVACAGGGGMVVVYQAGADALSSTIPCSQAKGVGGGCKLPGATG